MFEFQQSIVVPACLCLLLSLSAPARGDSGDLTTLGLFTGEEAEIASTGRIPRPVSRIAENVTVITADQIALLNAHTLDDVLQTVPGYASNIRTPGSGTGFFLQGAPQRHIQVLIDGVPQNELGDGLPDVGAIPVQQIERVEIIKGAASAVWGPALGGVINVVTKGPDPDRKAGGSVFSSIGERFTADLQADLGGTVRRLGYYLSGGTLHSDGLLPHNGLTNNNLSGKFTYELPSRGGVTLGLNYRDTDRGNVQSPAAFFDFSEDMKARFLSGFVTLTQPLGEQLSLELGGRYWHQNFDREDLGISNPVLLAFARNRQTISGGSAKLLWGDSLNSLVTGLEYEHASIATTNGFFPAIDTPFREEQTMDRVGVFANGAVTLGPVTILPGIRYDHTGIGADYTSFTLGATCRVTEKTVLRAYGARAYSLPLALPTQELLKVWTVQAGVESSDVPYLWLKGTFFYNNVRDENIDFSTVPPSPLFTKQTRQGFELESRTTQVYGFSLSGGYTFTDARDRDTHERVPGIPVHIAKMALRYEDRQWGVNGVLNGSYVWWNDVDFAAGHYKPVIWDLHLSKKLLADSDMSPEIFFSVRNLFNDGQYDFFLFKNTPRWVEGGVRFRF